MNELPEGLELAKNLCRSAWISSGATSMELEVAVQAIRAEHAQRLTLKHHAADLAQRVADLEAERDSLRDAVIGTICRQDAPEPGHWLMQAWDFVRELRAERDYLIDTMREEIDEGLRLRELGGALPDENITAMTERVIKERDALRARLAELARQ